MMSHAMMTPPLASPWVSIIAMREPFGVVYQDRLMRLVLSVDLRTASGGVMPFSAFIRAVLSSSRQLAMLIPSIVPPVWYAFAQTVLRVASQPLSSALMADRCAADALAKLACCAASMDASAVSVLFSKHCSMARVVSWAPQLAGAD